MQDFLKSIYDVEIKKKLHKNGFQVVAREDKGFLGKDFNTSPTLTFATKRDKYIFFFGREKGILLCFENHMTSSILMDVDRSCFNGPL